MLPLVCDTRGFSISEVLEAVNSKCTLQCMYSVGLLNVGFRRLEETSLLCFGGGGVP